MQNTAKKKVVLLFLIPVVLFYVSCTKEDDELLNIIKEPGGDADALLSSLTVSAVD